MAPLGQCDWDVEPRKNSGDFAILLLLPTRAGTTPTNAATSSALVACLGVELVRVTFFFSPALHM